MNIRPVCATMKKGLLIGFRTKHLAEIAQKIQPYQVEIHVATNLDEVGRIFTQEMIEFVILGYEHDSEHKLRTLARILSVSPASEIHVTGHKSEPIAFVTGILKQVGAE